MEKITLNTGNNNAKDFKEKFVRGHFRFNGKTERVEGTVKLLPDGRVVIGGRTLPKKVAFVRVKTTAT